VIDLDRLAKANQVLATFQPGIFLVLKNNRIAASWETASRKKVKTVTKVIQQKQRGLYPETEMYCDGTAACSIMQLVRWVRHKPVHSFETWVVWWTYRPDRSAGRSRNKKLFRALVEADWPTEVKCVVCGEKPHGIDWWSGDDKSGPCCSMGRCDPRLR